MSTRHWMRAALGACALAWLAAGAAQAQTQAPAGGAWPQRPIKVIVPYPPGGLSDIVLRTAADRMQVTLGQPIVLENRPGAGGNIGAGEAVRAATDGYTWFWSVDNVLTVNPHVYKRLNFDPAALVPVAVASQFSQTLVCHPSTGVKTLAELVAKARTERLNYASGGAGVPGHLAMELVLNAAGVTMDHVPYKGPAPAAQDVIGGQVPCGFLAGPTVLPHVRSGRLVALAVSGAQRSPVLPEVPTIAEAGYPGVQASFMLVLSAVKGTPQPVIDRFQAALVEALKSPAVVDTLRLTDQTVVASTQAQARDTIAATSRQWGEVVRRIGLALD